MDTLSVILNPIVLVMSFLLDCFHTVLRSWGLCILLLSATVSLFFLPLNRIGRNIEKKVSLRALAVSREVAKIDKSSKGEERFNLIEEIFQSHGYHPIQQVLKGTSIIMLLPILLSAIILFNQHIEMAGTSFLFVADLSEPDQIIWGFNLLPLVMFLVTFLDALTRFENNKSDFYQYLLLSLVLVALVYNMPASLLLFWIGNNLIAMILFRFSSNDIETSVKV